MIGKILKLYFCLFLFINIFTNDYTVYAKSSGYIEGGLAIENGNREIESYYGSVRKNYVMHDKVKNLFKLKAENRKTNKVRSKEEYRIDNQTKYLISNINYSFLELEYIDDRYGGYDYRALETIGLGRKLIAKDDISLNLQSSFGLRQIKDSSNISENSWVTRFSSDLKWKIKKDISFKQEIDLSINNNSIISKFDTNLKIMLIDSFYIKIDFFLENNSDVPENIKNTDSRIMFVLGYEL